MNTYMVLTATENMPSSCWGRYGRVAVVEVDESKLRDGDTCPRMISERAKGVVRIVAQWRRLNIGTTARCAYHSARSEADALIRELSAVSTGGE